MKSAASKLRFYVWLVLAADSVQENGHPFKASWKWPTKIIYNLGNCDPSLKERAVLAGWPAVMLLIALGVSTVSVAGHFGGLPTAEESPIYSACRRLKAVPFQRRKAFTRLCGSSKHMPPSAIV